MNMCMDRSRKDASLYVAAKRDIIIIRLGVGHAHDVLFDDWAFVQISGDIVRRRANQLYAFFKRLLVRVGTLKAW